MGWGDPAVSPGVGLLVFDYSSHMALVSDTSLTPPSGVDSSNVNIGPIEFRDAVRWNGNPLVVTVAYDAATHIMTASTAHGRVASLWTDAVQYTGCANPSYLGFTAGTGAAVWQRDISSVTVTTVGVAPSGEATASAVGTEVDCTKDTNKADPKCAVVAVLTAAFDLPIPVCDAKLADKTSWEYATFANSILDALTSSVGVSYTSFSSAQRFAAVTVVCAASRRLSSGARALAGSVGTVTINVPLPPPGTTLAASNLPAASLAASVGGSILAQVAVRVTALFSSTTATAGVFTALSAAVGMTIAPVAITPVVNPTFLEANPGAGAIVTATITTTVASNAFNPAVTSTTGAAAAWAVYAAAGVVVIILAVIVSLLLRRKHLKSKVKGTEAAGAASVSPRDKVVAIGYS